jgi:hypothetical protein
MAVTLFSIVPHSADIECLFSNLGGIQSVKQSNLSVWTMEDLGQLRVHYTHYLHQQLCLAGKPICRKHAHMHTKKNPGVNEEVVEQLSEDIQVISDAPADGTVSPEVDDDVSDAKLEREFEKIQEMMSGFTGVDTFHSEGIEAGKSYSWEELTRVEQGIAPPLSKTVSIYANGENGPPAPVTWSMADILG